MTKPEPGLRRRWRPFASPLTRRILAVNIVPPVLLMVGLFYLDLYKQGLVRAELESLSTQAAMVAGAVGEGAVQEEALGLLELNPELAQQMVRRLAEPAQIRARLFDAVGSLAADSRFLLYSQGIVQIEDLPPPKGRGMRAELRHLWEQVATWMPYDETLPTYKEHAVQRAEQYPEVMAALGGSTASAVRNRRAGGLVLSAAVPVQRYKQVVGALMVTGDGSGIARALFQVRLAIVEVFAVTLLITTLLSLYLAGTIARPIRRLALAAERVRHGHGRHPSIPDLSTRRDEIGELSLALTEMTEALWRRMDAIEAFAADVAHEIKNPLTSVRSAVETAARIQDPEKQRKLLSIIQDDVERLNRLITDISDASRLDAELSRAETEPVDIAAMLATLADVYGSTESRVAIALDLPQGVRLVVPGIEGRLVQVLRNLIGNALSFSPDGGTIRLAAQREGKFVRIEVADEGPGIPDGKLETIFDRFYSERPASEKFGTHSGLGLSISKQIVDALGGLIWAENRLAADGSVTGALFVVKLPAA